MSETKRLIEQIECLDIIINACITTKKKQIIGNQILGVLMETRKMLTETKDRLNVKVTKSITREEIEDLFLEDYDHKKTIIKLFNLLKSKGIEVVEK